MAADRLAPEGKVWLCMMCGKTAKDMYGEERGWDESCALNCITVDESTKQPTEQQVREFTEERERRLAAWPKRMEDFRKSLLDGSDETDPELLKLAQEAIDRRNARGQAAPPLPAQVAPGAINNTGRGE